MKIFFSKWDHFWGGFQPLWNRSKARSHMLLTCFQTQERCGNGISLRDSICQSNCFSKIAFGRASEELCNNANSGAAAIVLVWQEKIPLDIVFQGLSADIYCVRRHCSVPISCPNGDEGGAAGQDTHHYSLQWKAITLRPLYPSVLLAIFSNWPCHWDTIYH